MSDERGGPEDEGSNVIPLLARAPEPEATPEGIEPGTLGPVPPELLVPALEACLFALSGVVTVDRLATALRVSNATVQGALDLLQERLLRTGSGVRLVEIGDGWQLRTDARLAPWVAAARGGKPLRLSRAAIETIAVIAFRQPVSKGVIDEVRGVDSGGVLRMLSDRGLIRVVGRSDEPGRPMTWGTTQAFLEMFGLRSLADLPTLRDLRQVDADDSEASVVPVALDLARDDVARMERMLAGPRLVPTPEG